MSDNVHYSGIKKSIREQTLSLIRAMPCSCSLITNDGKKKRLMCNRCIEVNRLEE